MRRLSWPVSEELPIFVKSKVAKDILLKIKDIITTLLTLTLVENKLMIKEITALHTRAIDKILLTCTTEKPTLCIQSCL